MPLNRNNYLMNGLNNSRLTNWRSLLIAFMLALISGGCDWPIERPLKVASHEWPGYEPLHLARELGYFDEEKIHVYEVPSATASIRAFRNGYIDVVALTLDEALLLLEDKVPIKVLLVMDVSNGADAIVARPPIQSLKDIKDKAVGVESMALGAYMLTRALIKGGLQPESVKPIYIPFNKHEEAYKQHLVDILVTFEPVKSKIVQLGGRILIDSKELPNEIFDVLVIRETALNSHLQEVKSLLNGWFKAVDYLASNKEDAAFTVARRINSTPEQFINSLNDIILPSFEDNQRFLAGNDPELIHIAQQLSSVMLSNNLLSTELDIHSLIYSDINKVLINE